MKKTHGMFNSPEYEVWIGIKNRCFNKNEKQYSNYGARGISVCEAWKNSFQAFYQDVGQRPSEKHSIDRIDNNGNYEPGNVRWATKTEQVINQRLRKDNKSGFKGIIFDKHHRKWKSYICIDNKIISLGYFANIEKAIEARDEYIVENELSEYKLQSEHFKNLYPE